MSDEQTPVLSLLNEVTNVHKASYLIIFCWLLCGSVSWAGSKKKKSSALFNSLFFNLSYWLNLNTRVPTAVHFRGSVWKRALLFMPARVFW